MFYAHRCLSKHQNSPVSRTAVIILTICLLFFTASAGLAFAEDGDGTGGGNGDGNGKNRNIPLTLVSSSVKDGDTGVPLDPVIQLDFNKNVSNITVLANNKKCFHLTEEGGEAVPISSPSPTLSCSRITRSRSSSHQRKNLFPKPATASAWIIR